MTYAEAALPIDQGLFDISGRSTTCPTSRTVRWATGVFAVALAGNALAAYNVGSVPFPWLAQCLPLCFVACQIASSGRLLRVPGLGIMGLFLIWAAAVTVVQAATGDYSRLAPALMTVPYSLYLTLRSVNLLAALAQIYLTYWLLVQGRREEVCRTVAVVGFMAALAALYIYLAQIFGWWEPTRTRMGTSGEGQSAIFTYAFHRATGTFREPSHLAEWLMVPFFLSLLAPRASRAAIALPIASVILLTGSLTGILGAGLGFVAAAAMLNPLRRGNLKIALGVVVIVGFSYVLFSAMAVAYSDGHADLLQVIEDRLEPILFGGGLGETNREDRYRFLADTPIPVVGMGLGNPNLTMSKHLGVDVVASLLSLYYNVLYSTGYLGLGLLIYFLVQPIGAVWRGRRTGSAPQKLVVLAAYCSWLVTFSVHSEELTIMFASIYAMACYEAACCGEADDKEREQP